LGKDNKKTEKVGRYYFDLVVKEGNTPILDVKEKKLSTLEEVLEMLNRKL